MDLDKVVKLLQVEQLSRDHPKLAPIKAEVLAELDEIVKAAEEEQAKKAEAKKKEEEAKQAKEAKEAADKAAKEAKAAEVPKSSSRRGDDI